MRGLLALVLALSLGGCAQILGLHSGHLGDGGAESDGGGHDGGEPDGPAPDGGVGCISLCGSTVGCGTCPNAPTVDVSTYRYYNIDVAEVTVGQYQAYLAIGPGLGIFGNLPQCDWLNDQFTPADWQTQLASPDFPVRGVSWCQAAGYCAWATRELCGRMGALTMGGALDYGNFDKVGQNGSEWYNACTNGNTAQAYPNPGEPTTPGLCDVGTPDGGVRSATGSSCIGGLTGLLDMSGNVAEWEDCCDGTSGEADLCRVRGGSYASTLAEARCDADRSVRRDTQSPEIGFRCCGK
jgi:sulfatase modifying factor 1